MVFGYAYVKVAISNPAADGCRSAFICSVMGHDSQRTDRPRKEAYGVSTSGRKRVYMY